MSSDVLCPVVRDSRDWWLLLTDDPSWGKWRERLSNYSPSRLTGSLLNGFNKPGRKSTEGETPRLRARSLTSEPLDILGPCERLSYRWCQDLRLPSSGVPWAQSDRLTNLPPGKIYAVQVSRFSYHLAEFPFNAQWLCDIMLPTVSRHRD